MEIFNLSLFEKITARLLLTAFIATAFIFSCENKNDKSLSVGKLMNGRREGLWKIYDKDGILRECNNYKNDTLNGTQVTFDENGKIYTKAHRRMGIFVDSFL